MCVYIYNCSSWARFELFLLLVLRSIVGVAGTRSAGMRVSFLRLGNDPAAFTFKYNNNS